MIYIQYHHSVLIQVCTWHSYMEPQVNGSLYLCPLVCCNSFPSSIFILCVPVFLQPISSPFSKIPPGSTDNYLLLTHSPRPTAPSSFHAILASLGKRMRRKVSKLPHVCLAGTMDRQIKWKSFVNRLRELWGGKASLCACYRSS